MTCRTMTWGRKDNPDTESILNMALLLGGAWDLVTPHNWAYNITIVSLTGLTMSLHVQKS